MGNRRWWDDYRSLELCGGSISCILATDEEALERRINAIKATPDSWAVDETRLQVYRDRIVPCVRLQLHPLLTRQAKEAGGAYDRLLQAVLAYANGEGTTEDCLYQLDGALP